MDLSSVTLTKADLRGCNLTGTVLLAKCGAMLSIPTVPQFSRPVSGMSRGENYFHLTVPALEGLEWRLSACGELSIGFGGTCVLYSAWGTVACSRVGTSIEFRGPKGTANVPCTPGVEASVKVDVWENYSYGSRVTVEM
ncbi:hypothetical protein KIPB_013966 [Kipferlia bialata]|uniref:Uncharacterized protein n=1 Tax=Kipferlia bialata TaxID=797122 RepID=A0A391P221_9EUKA|nr:hypothetical protein KIPB_013966 [Kipferlia bialata]|eukprot:g13966.t1